MIATVATHIKTFHLPFVKMLQEQGHEVDVACSLDVQLNELPVVLEIPFSRSPYSLNNVRAYRQIRNIIQNRCYNLVHVHTPVAAFITRLAARDLQVPVLYTAHGFHFYKNAPLKNWLIYYTAERWAARWTDGLIVMNGEDYENAKRLGFIPGKNLFYVHGVGVDLREFSPSREHNGRVRKELGIGCRDVVVTCIGEFNNNKNQNFLLNAWSRIAVQTKKAHLLLVGSGVLCPALERKALEEGIPRLHFLGFRTDVPQILRETDIVALVSKREGLPRCIMEAMAAGMPVVATDVRGSRDLVEDGKTGLLVRLGDTEGLAAALMRLISDTRLRIEMGRNARSKIGDYSIETVLNEMAAIYGMYLKC